MNVPTGMMVPRLRHQVAQIHVPASSTCEQCTAPSAVRTSDRRPGRTSDRPAALEDLHAKAGGRAPDSVYFSGCSCPLPASKAAADIGSCDPLGQFGAFDEP